MEVGLHVHRHVAPALCCHATHKSSKSQILLIQGQERLAFRATAKVTVGMQGQGKGKNGSVKVSMSIWVENHRSSLDVDELSGPFDG
jgi:hypothetical protein